MSEDPATGEAAEVEAEWEQHYADLSERERHAQEMRKHFEALAYRNALAKDAAEGVAKRAVDRADAAEAELLSPLRYGQALFNDLYRVAPEIADRIRGGEDDPFYEDRRVPAFLRALVAQARAAGAAEVWAQYARQYEHAEKMPRWDHDKAVLANGWAPGRCGNCGEPIEQGPS